jgi:hypothetical protein
MARSDSRQYWDGGCGAQSNTHTKGNGHGNHNDRYKDTYVDCIAVVIVANVSGGGYSYHIDIMIGLSYFLLLCVFQFGKLLVETTTFVQLEDK